MLKLSIIITLYKSEKYIAKCLDSVLDQDIPETDYEIVVVNDGSPDRSYDIALEYASRHSNIVALTHENKGLAGARNTGLDAANAQYVTFVDPDDYILTNSFAALLKQMDDENLDMLRMNYQMVNEDYQEIERPKDARLVDYSPCIMDGKEFLAERLGYGCFVWTYIYRMSVIKDNGIRFTQGIYFDDTDWLPRVLCVAKRVNTVDFKRYFYVQREGSLVKTSDMSSHFAKLDGMLRVVGILCGRKKEQESPVAADWYGRMISKLSLSVLDTVSSICYERRGEYIKQLKELGVFPLKQLHTTRNWTIKVMICNISADLYCFTIHRSRSKNIRRSFDW